jgi:transposase-like protein
MARRGRPPKGLGHVDSLDADESAKERIKTILRTLSGDLSVEEACSRLGLSETHFHDLRTRALQGMAAGIEPRPAGRPPKEPEEPPEVTELKGRLRWLEEEVEIERLRTEIALVNPKLLREPKPWPPPERGEKGGSTKKKGRRSRRRDGDDRSGG